MLKHVLQQKDSTKDASGIGCVLYLDRLKISAFAGYCDESIKAAGKGYPPR